jgi:hypothetical protein
MNNLLIISTCVATLRLAPTKYACALFLETEVVHCNLIFEQTSLDVCVKNHA